MKNGYLLILILTLLGCNNERSSNWTLWVYPQGNMMYYQKITNLKSYDNCKEAALNIISLLPNKNVAKFECGYKCKEQKSYYQGFKPINICAETRDD